MINLHELYFVLYSVVWNVFLALIPVVLAYVINWGAGRLNFSRTVLVLLGMAWLVFLPNTCYLLTEWRHYLTMMDGQNLYLRSRGNPAITLMLMAYTGFFMLYSGVGLVTFALAIRPLARLARQKGVNLAIIGTPLFILLSVGVYLGLVLRYNSWDLLTRPTDIWVSVIELTARPLLSLFILGFAMVLWAAYAAVDIWIDGYKFRKPSPSR